MARSLDKLGIIELLKKTGFYLPATDFINCCTNIDVSDKLAELVRNGTEAEFFSFIEKNERYFQKDKIIFNNYLCSKGYKKIPEVTANPFDSKVREKLNIIEDYLKSNPVILMDVDGRDLLEYIYDSRDYITDTQKEKHKIQREKAIRKLDEIKGKIGLEPFMALQVLTDIDSIYGKIPNIGGTIRSNVIVNTYRKELGYNNEDILEILSGEEEINEPFSTFMPYFKEELYKRAEYLDIDKFLLLSAYRAKMELERFYDGEKGLKEMYQRVIETSHELIENKKCKINGKITIMENGKNGEEIWIKYSAAELAKDVSEKIIDGEYYGKPDLNKLRTGLLSGEMKISDIYSIKVLKLLNLSPDEKIVCMSRHQENMIDLFRNGYMTKKEVIGYIHMIRETASLLEGKETVLPTDELHIRAATILELVNSENGLSNEEVVEMYLAGDIPSDEMDKLKDIAKEVITEEQLIQHYRNIGNEELKEETERYFSLFRNVKISGASQDDKEEISNNIVLELGDSMEEEDFIELYRRNLITIDTLVEWNGEQFVSDMFSKSLLKPVDSKKLVADRKIDIEQIKRNLRLKTVSDEEKMSFIITTFDGVDDQALREELFQTLRVSNEENSSSIAKKTRGTRGVRTERAPRGNEYVLDPCYKMQLLMLVDSDYNYSLTRDGHMILELPNLNKVIIEKMFKNTRNSVEIANNASTYILDTDKYRTSNVISESNKIDRTKLYDLCKNKEANRYYHTVNWGEAMKDAFDIEHSGRYTEEDKKQLDGVITKIKATRKLREI